MKKYCLNQECEALYEIYKDEFLIRILATSHDDIDKYAIVNNKYLFDKPCPVTKLIKKIEQEEENIHFNFLKKRQEIEENNVWWGYLDNEGINVIKYSERQDIQTVYNNINCKKLVEPFEAKNEAEALEFVKNKCSDIKY